MTATAPLIDCTDLTRRYTLHESTGWWRRTRRDLTAVDHLTLQVHAGESVGYIGANGAGKSTTIKMLTGILQPTLGELRVCGYQPVPQRRQLAYHIGVVFGQRSQLWLDLPLRESYDILAAIYRLDPAQWKPRLDELITHLELGEYLGSPVRTLSLGQRMRGEIAAALLHQPPLVILDEPTIGLDVVSKTRLRAFLAAERATHGTTLLLTTHDMGDVQELCDRLVVLDQGRMAFDGTQAQLHEAVGMGRRLTVTCESVADAAAAHTWKLPDHVRIEERKNHAEADPRVVLTFDASHTTAATVLAAVSQHTTVTDLSLSEPTIESLVHTMYEAARQPEKFTT